MWKAKFKVFDETGTFATLARRYKIIIYGYMINHYIKNNYHYFTLSVFLDCDEETKKLVINDLWNFKRVNNLEDQGSFLICELKITDKMEKEKKPSLFYNPALIQVKPFILDPEGWEELEFAAFNRKDLDKVLEISEKLYKLKLLYIKQEKIDSFSVMNLFPKLTDKQKEMLKLAIENGYYSYPRKTNIKELAKRNKMSFSTFQEHLRKAENKLIPFIARKSEL